MMKKTITMFVMIMLVFTLVGCQTESENIKVGVVGVTSGFASYYGQQQTKGLELALDELNNKGMNLELIYEDSAADSNKAVTSLQKLINVDGVDYVIGDSWVSTTAVMVPVANENEVVLISTVAMLDALSEDDFFFRTIPTTSSMMKELADYAYNEMGSRKVGIIQQQTVYGEEHTQYFKEYFEELGGEVVIVEKIQLTQNDMQTELLKIKEADVDTIFNLHASSGALGLVMKQAKELDINVKWIASIGAENGPLITEYSDVAQDLVYPFTYVGDESFVEKYVEKYDQQPSFVAANAYDALNLLAKAINDGEDVNDVREYLSTIENYEGAGGVLSFDENGDVVKDIVIKKVDNGEFVLLE